ncbi:conserved hypothetical protein [Ricinus communis]|uniref:Uncharacterized protein n=1 Tax=Ricinus communis TaxID=3988 RepID=B9TMA7_RICCO|nr:conserved hypothetical protein [Ricinus communis]
MYGSAEGISSARISVSRSVDTAKTIAQSWISLLQAGERVASTGNTDTMNADARTVGAPKPNQMTSNGAIAITGTV